METTKEKLSEKIEKMNDQELESFVRERLKFNRHELEGLKIAGEPHRRFDMSGYGENGSCHIYNTSILNLFSDCGIYDRMKFLYLDAYKGSMTLHYAMWEEDEFHCDKEEYSGLGTVDIIIEILNLTVINCTSTKRKM